MTSNNINKIVQSNINLKPWVLSKNTSEIVNTYIQRIYKQMPHQFKKEKPVRVAATRVENKGPLRTLKTQTRSPLSVVPTTVPPRKTIKEKERPEKPIVSALRTINMNNVQIASKFSGINLTPSKRLLKSPNYKIYKSRRFGSSASSSRSSLYRRYEERRRHRQSYPAQINYLIRSFHTNKLEPTYARYLMPARNQQVEGRLGSIPDAVKYSSDIQSDLMPIDCATRTRISIGYKSPRNTKLNQPDIKPKEELVSPALQGKYRGVELRESPVKTVKQSHEKSIRKIRISPEQRELGSDNMGRITQMKHPKPSNELFTALHDRTQTELHEKHRRNRMLKLGLIEPLPESTEAEVESSEIPTNTNQQTTIKPNTPIEQKAITKGQNQANIGPVKNALNSQKGSKTKDQQLENAASTNHPSSSSSIQSVQPQSNNLMPSTKAPKYQTPSEKLSVEEKKAVNSKESLAPPSSLPQSSPKLNSTMAPSVTTVKRSTPTPSTSSAPKSYQTKSPIAVIRSQMPKKNYQAYRYNRADFFSTKKY